MEKDEFKKFVDNWKLYKSDLSNRVSFKEFDQVIKDTVDLLDFFSQSEAAILIKKKNRNKIHFLWGEFLFATSKTLDCISSCCRKSCFADANMLLRKYKDNLFLYLYILKMAETQSNFLEELEFLEQKGKDNDAVDAWFDNSAENGAFKRKLDINNYWDFLKNDSFVFDCIEIHGLENRWQKLKDKQNNYTHNNGRAYLIDNIIAENNSERASILLKEVYNDITFITALFLSFIILIKPNYISSSDYINCLECGLDPPEGCQYWVAPIIQNYIDTYLKQLHPGLKQFLKENNRYGMMIE